MTIGGSLTAQFRCSPGTVDPGTGVISFIDPAPSFATTMINGEPPPPPPIDAALELFVSGPTRAAASDKTVAGGVINVGTTVFTVCPADMAWDIEVNGVDTTGSVSLLTGECTALQPGRATRFRFRWTYGAGEVAPGAGVKYSAKLSVAGDSNPANDSATVTQIAR
jgi:hypothetical protein